MNRLPRVIVALTAVCVFGPCAGLGWGRTVVHLGAIHVFTGPDDPVLDLGGDFAYAINFSPDDPVRVLKGVTFQPDNRAIAGAVLTGPQNVVGWQAKPEFGASAEANVLEEIMHDIRWANAGSGERLQARLTVEPGIPYKLQILISGNRVEDRRWDIRLNGQNAVDEITSLGPSPGESYSPNRSILWVHEFVPATTTVTVEMGSLFGANDGGDRNPIWQALTLERVFIPPAPDEIALVPVRFFAAQSGAIGEFNVSDGKFGATHVLAMAPGDGADDNTKFSLSGSHLLAAPHDFSAETPGTEYKIRVRATDAADGERHLERAFTVTLAAPRAPTSVVLDASSLSRGLIAGQLAGRLAAVDPDDFDRHEFSLVPGEGSDDNGLFAVEGVELRLSAALPASAASISLRLRATDLAGLSVESVLVLPVVEPRLRINEVLAVATGASLPLDQTSQPQDWIEIYNELAQPVNLQGWRLSDDPDEPAKWTFPAVTIPPNGYLLVFASGSTAEYESGPPHAGFAVSQSGETLVLSRPDGAVVSELAVPEMFPNVTWGSGGAAGGEIGFLRTPTPGAPNSALAAAGRNEVVFSEPHGFKSATFALSLNATVPGSTIRYTLDGSLPTASSPLYASPVTIAPVTGSPRSGTRIVRAVAFHPDAAYAPVVTQTYLFVNGVAGPRVDGVVGQSNFYSSIRNHATYGALLGDAFLSLPAVSLVINNSSDLPYSETESSLELFDPQGGEPGFTIPAGVERSGTTSLGFAKGSMSARFRGEYGASRLYYPVFGRHPHDAQGAVSEFHELRLRSCSHDTHSWLGTAENPPVPYGSPPVTRSGDAQLVRNIWIEDMQLLMGQPGKHGRMVNMFVNGNYYGIYHIQEHPDDDYMGTYYPGGSEDFHFTTGATKGSQHGSESWSTVWAQLKASLSNYTQARRWVDVTSLADYMILSFYAGNDWDWSAQHNWAAAGPRLPDRGGWKFFQQDQDICLQALNADCTDQGVPDGVFAALMAHADFRTLFRDRIYRHLFHDGVLTPAKVAGYYDLRATEIFDAIVAETARWQPTSSVGPLPWDRDGEWTVERNYLMNTYFPQRTTVLLNQLRNRGWYPVDAPEMSRRGGAIDPGTAIALTGPAGAALYYTLDGSDPRLPGGGVNPAAIAYSATVTTQTLVEAHDDVAGRGAVWKYRVGAGDPGAAWNTAGFDDSSWPQGAVECGYGDGDEVTNVGFVDTDPATPGDQRNLTTYFRHVFQVDNPAEVTGLVARVKRDDGAIVYLNGREVFRSAMPPGEVTYATPGNGGASVADDGNTWFSKNLIPAEYTLLAGANLLAVEIHNASPASSDISFDLELLAAYPITPQPIVIEQAVTLRARALAGNEWSGLNEAAFVLTGTQPASAASLALSEIHYHPEGEGQGDAEFLEFTNTADHVIDLTGVSIGTAVVFTFPSGIVLQPGEAVVVVKDAGLFDARYRAAGSPWYHAGIRVAGAWSGSLSNGGEEIVVLDAAGGTICRFAWSDDGAWPGRADGRGSSLEMRAPAEAPTTLEEKNAYLATPENWRPSSGFHGSPGRAGAGPDRRIAINEVRAAPVAPALDFIELLNVSDAVQSLGHWFLSDSSGDYRKYRLPAGASLAPGAWLLLDETHFNNPDDPGCLVPFALSSAGEDVFLIEADADGNLLKFADHIEFDASAGGMTWGRVPDGSGPLHLLPNPTPGAPNTSVAGGYDDWVTVAFPPGSPSSLTSAHVDPDGDGLTNWAEFAFATNPLTADEPLLKLTPDPDGGLTIEYRIRDDATAMAASLALSGDLTSWEPAGGAVVITSETPQGDGSKIVTARLTVGPGHRYLRLEARALP